MFSISNEVAYNNRMFCKTHEPEHDMWFMLNKSSWFDIDDKEVGNKDHTVVKQIDLIGELLINAIKKTSKLPDVYIITPFLSIKRSLDKKLRHILQNYFPSMDNDGINRWISENCGTIHTFQGKEANEVLLVLGCDKHQGFGAAKWVGNKPNIINVAVSRAKYRLGVIGHYNLWNEIPYVQLVCRKLHDSIIK